MIGARSPKSSLAEAALTLITYLLAVIIIFPIAWVVVTSFKTEADAITIPPKLFFTPTLENFRTAWESFIPSLGTSVVVVLGSTLLAFLLGVPAAFAFAHKRTRGGERLLMWILGTRMMPPAGIALPLFLIYRDLGLLDTHLGLIAIYATINLSLVIWMMQTYFSEIPREIYEAGRLDGLGMLGELWFIGLPLVIPGAFSTALLCIILSWNEFLLALILNSVDTVTLSVFIASFRSSMGLFIAKMSAASVLTIAPIMVLGWVAQKGLIRGLTLGAVK